MCALTRDLKVLPDGDLTEIGEKGSARMTTEHCKACFLSLFRPFVRLSCLSFSINLSGGECIKRYSCSIVAVKSMR